MNQGRSGFFRKLWSISVLASLLSAVAVSGAGASAPVWDDAGSMGTTRRNHTATLLPNGKVLVAGGWNGGSFLASTELYDTGTNSFSSIGVVQLVFLNVPQDANGQG